MRAWIVAAMAVCVSACGGGSKSPTAPSPPPVAQISGNWIGNLESQNYRTESMEAVFQQVGNTINGTYVLPGAGASGNINGTVDANNFIGSISFTIGSACTIAGNINGTASASSLRWTSVGFATGTCNIARPVDVRVTLQRR